MSKDIITLNVGGVYFITRRATLTASPFFDALVRHRWEDEIFVDRDPFYFRHVLNWMRGVRVLPDEDVALRELAWEADYYCMQDMRDAIARAKGVSIARAISGVQAELRQRS